MIKSKLFQSRWTDTQRKTGKPDRMNRLWSDTDRDMGNQKRLKKLPQTAYRYSEAKKAAKRTTQMERKAMFRYK